ncbi:MAG: hypothetical protein GY847_26400 [Proteobacteria bacterium]|nr:hypothetical protein [Pseudomonadota bacterium]
MKTISKCLSRGLRQLKKQKRLILPYYLANLFFALLVALPVGLLLKAFANGSLMQKHSTVGIQWDFLLEFIHYNKHAQSSLIGLAVVAAAAYWTLNLFLSGGALALFAGNEKYSPRAFWGGNARFFGRFARLGLMVLLILVLLLCARFVVDFGVWLVFGSDPYQYILYWSGWIKVGLGYIGILLTYMIFDYARIDLVLRNETKTRRSLWRSVKLVCTNLQTTTTLALILFVIGAALPVLFLGLLGLAIAPNTATLILLFSLQQLYIISRMILRLTSYASQMELIYRLK